MEYAEWCGSRHRMRERAAAAFGVLRRVPNLADLLIWVRLDIDRDDESTPPLYAQPLRGAKLLPWRTLESLALQADGAALLPLLTQPEVAPQLSRLRALCVGFQNYFDDGYCRSAIHASPLAPLWRAPWIGQLTRLRLSGLSHYCGHYRGFFEALPAAPGALLLPQMQQLHIALDDEGFLDELPSAAQGVRRLFGACSPGELRGLTFEGFEGTRGALAPHASALTALTSLRLGCKDRWAADANAAAGSGGGGGGGGSDAGAAAVAARAQSLAAFLARRAPPGRRAAAGGLFPFGAL